MNRTLLYLCLFATVAVPQSLPARGLPEPGVTMYGVVLDAQGRRVLTGRLEMILQAPGRSPLRVQTALSDLNSQFSYVLTVPLEMAHAGLRLSAGAIEVKSSPITVDRSQVTLDGQALKFARAEQTSFRLTTADRGSFQRIDLTLGTAGPAADGDGDGLLDAWERQHFGDLRFSAGDDPDRDGVPNRAEQLAGTNPNDATSRLAFISINAEDSGAPVITWSSTAGKTYSILRSANLLGGFAPIKNAVAATPPANRFVDAGATGDGPFFYLIRLSE